MKPCTTHGFTDCEVCDPLHYTIKLPRRMRGLAVELHIINAILEYHEEGSSRHCISAVPTEEGSTVWSHHRLGISVEFTS